jgi:uncharacterized membrane protein HdeD (DUF308 family)
MCPLCLSLVASSEQELISHLLGSHKEAAAALGLSLSVINLLLIKQPVRALAFDALVLGCAVLISRADGGRRRR